MLYDVSVCNCCGFSKEKCATESYYSLVDAHWVVDRENKTPPEGYEAITDAEKMISANCHFMQPNARKNNAAGLRNLYGRTTAVIQDQRGLQAEAMMAFEHFINRKLIVRPTPYCTAYDDNQVVVDGPIVHRSHHIQVFFRSKLMGEIEIVFCTDTQHATVRDRTSGSSTGIRDFERVLIEQRIFIAQIMPIIDHLETMPTWLNRRVAK